MNGAKVQDSDAPGSAHRPPGTGGASTNRAEWLADSAGAVSLLEALSLARASAAELTGLPVDGISSSEPDGEDGWTVTVDVLEAAARMGENDLLCAYRIRIARDGSLAGYARVRRYRREEGL